MEGARAGGDHMWSSVLRVCQSTWRGQGVLIDLAKVLSKFVVRIVSTQNGLRRDERRGSHAQRHHRQHPRRRRGPDLVNVQDKQRDPPPQVASQAEVRKQE